MREIMRFINKGVFILISSIIMLVSCGEPIPIKEMAMARKEIARAMSVKADKYAPKLMDEANSKLMGCHDLIKKDELEKCKKSAEESSSKAIAAYNKAIPLLAKDTIEIAEKSIEEADKAYAEKLAAKEFQSSKDLLAKAKEENTNKKYYEAYITALEADKMAKNARNQSLGQKNILKESIDEVKIVLSKAKSYEKSDTESAKISLAEENLRIAEESYNNLELKKGFAAIEVAKINADEAYIGSAGATAKEYVTKAETGYGQAKDSQGASVAVDEMAAAKESLDNARAMLAESKFNESIEFARESARLSAIVVETKKPAGTDTTVATGDTGEKGRVSGKATGEDENYYYYKVKYRETLKDCLWRIAGKYYKNPWLWKKIYAENKELIKNPHLIRPGWIIRVPKIKK
jgi:nucleoid-associated protein YgaU